MTTPQYATKKDLQQTATAISKNINEAVDTILSGIDEMAKGQSKRMDSLEGKIDTLTIHAKKTDETLQWIKAEISFIKSELRDLNVEFSKTASKQELETLKSRIDRLERKVNKYLAQ